MTLVVLTRSSELASRNILFHCENSSVVYALSNGTSLCRHIMTFVRFLLFTCAHHNMVLRAVHINLVHNHWADVLSRLQVDKFLARYPVASRQPTPVLVLNLAPFKQRQKTFLPVDLLIPHIAPIQVLSDSFCNLVGTFFLFDPLPVSEDTLILSSTHLAQRIKPQSIHVYLAAARSLHVAQGLPNPLQPGLKLKQTLRGIERQHFSPPKQKMSLTFDILADRTTFIF